MLQLQAKTSQLSVASTWNPECHECALFQLSCSKLKHASNTTLVSETVNSHLDKKWKRMDKTVVVQQLDMLKDEIDALRLSIKLDIAAYKKLKNAFE